MDYKHAWKVRWIQLLIVNILAAALMIYTFFDAGPEYRTMNQALEYVLDWFILSWIVASIVGAFTKNGSWISNTIASVFSWGVLGLASGFSNDGSMAMAFVFTISLFKCVIGFAAITAILCVAIVAYPFSTVYYFVKSLQSA